MVVFVAGVSGDIEAQAAEVPAQLAMAATLAMAVFATGAAGIGAGLVRALPGRLGWVQSVVGEDGGIGASAGADRFDERPSRRTNLGAWLFVEAGGGRGTTAWSVVAGGGVPQGSHDVEAEAWSPRISSSTRLAARSFGTAALISLLEA